MARSNGRAAVIAALCALGYASWVQLQLAGFVNASGASSSSSRALRSRVSLAATAADVEIAMKEFKLQQWAANKLASEGSPLAAASASRAQQAEALYNTVKAQAAGQAPPVPASVAAAAPVASAPVVTSAVSAADLAEAKKRVELLTWVTNKLASEGSPQAAMMKGKMDQAVAAFEALKLGKEAGAAMPADVPAASAPVASAPVVTSAVSAADLAEAKKQVELLTWVATKLASEGSPQAAAMKAKMDHAVATYESMKQGGAAMPAGAPAAPAPVASAPVAAAPATPASDAEVAEAKKAMELARWAADALASKGSPQVSMMAAKAQQAMQTYEALEASQKQLVGR